MTTAEFDFSNIVIATPSFKLPSKEELESNMNDVEIAENQAEMMIKNQDVDYSLYITSIVNSTEFKQHDKGYDAQHIDFKNYYVNYINDVKSRSKDNIPQINNIKRLLCNTMRDNMVIEGRKGFKEHILGNNYFDTSINQLINDLDIGVYELLPYENWNIYGCSLVKTCFNTIGKEYEYIHPFIDFDLTTSENISDSIFQLFQLIHNFAIYVIGLSDLKVSAIGYSNLISSDVNIPINNFYQQPSITPFNQSSYLKIQLNPNAAKALSVHVVFYDVKIECRELKARIMKSLSILNQFIGFDISPYLSGSLRHIGSIKAGLTDIETAKNKRVSNLTPQEILEQLITYHNKFIQYKYIHLDINNIHNKPQIPQQFLNLSSNFNNLEIKLYYANEELNLNENENVIELFINRLLSANNVDVSYAKRWKLLTYYVMFKQCIKSLITDDNIDKLLPGEHTSVKTQINCILSNVHSNNPKPLLKYLKSLANDNGVCVFDYEIIDKSNEKYVIPSHFGQHKVEELSKANTFKDVIEILTGSFAVSTAGDLFYFCSDGIREYKINGKPNLYLSKLYPSKLSILINPETLYSGEQEDKQAEQENQLLIDLFKTKLDELTESNKKPQFRLTVHTLIPMFIKYYDVYREDAMTAFKLNGYCIDKVKPEVLKDVHEIIKLFENRLVDGCITGTDNTLQEFLRSIKYLFTKHEKPEKAFLAIDPFGATGKSLFFGKIIKDLFGFAGLNDNSLNCLDSSFSDSYNFLYTVFNEVSKGTHNADEITSTLKQLSDNIITSARVKNVQNKKVFKNNGIYVLLSNSETLNGALNYYDTALMSRFVLIEFKPFEADGKVDSLKGTNYYSMIDKYKTYNDPYYTYSYDFRNALFKYIMDLDISTRTAGRAQFNQYKVDKYQELANQDLQELKTNPNNPNAVNKLRILEDNVFSVDINKLTLSKYSAESKYVGFKMSDLTRSRKEKEMLLKVLDYLSAYKKRIRYTLLDGLDKKYNDNQFELIICENTRFINIVNIDKPESNPFQLQNSMNFQSLEM